jgi:FKBP-type peptidyl-prolyl cis-trans isomerase
MLQLTALLALSVRNVHLVGRRPLVASVASAVAASALPATAVVQIDPSQVKSTKSGIKYVVVKEGKCPTADPTGLAGSCLPQLGSFAVIDYTGFLPGGQVFDTTEKKGGKPLVFKIGASQVIKGFEDVVLQMLPGEEVQALIPSALAYGEKGVCTEGGECLIPPNSNLKYYIKLKKTAILPS